MVTIIIVNWNGRPLLSECLCRLQKQSFTNYNIAVVDNGSNDGSASFVSSAYPKAELIANTHNLGFARANNMAIRNCRSKYIALINNDAFAEPDWLENLVKALEDNPEAGMAASKLLLHDTPEIIDRAGDGYSNAGAGILLGRGKRAVNYNKGAWIFGACAGAALYRTDMFTKIGLFDEDYFLLYEDVDLSFRAQLAGYKCIYVPEAIAYHKSSKTIGKDSEVSVYYGHRNLEWTYIKNMPKKLILRTLIPHCLYIVFSFCFFAFKGHAGIYLKSKLDALAGFKKAIKKRKHVQAHRKVSSNYIYNLLETELFFSRYNHHRPKNR